MSKGNMLEYATGCKVTTLECQAVLVKVTAPEDTWYVAAVAETVQVNGPKLTVPEFMAYWVLEELVEEGYEAYCLFQEKGKTNGYEDSVKAGWLELVGVTLVASIQVEGKWQAVCQVTMAEDSRGSKVTPA